MNIDEYRNRIRRTGIAIKAGETVMVTKIRVKEKLIEFQLGGGGYGTFGDETDSSTYVASAVKSPREKSLEENIKHENDPAHKRDMQRELDQLRKARENEDRRNRTVAAIATETKKARIQEVRLQAGSRFNIRYPGGVPPNIAPEDIVSILAEYVEFPSGKASAERGTAEPATQRVEAGRAGGPIWKGMTRDQVEAVLGAPSEESERMEGSFRVKTAVFVRVDQHIKAEFVEGVLVRYSITSK